MHYVRLNMYLNLSHADIQLYKQLFRQLFNLTMEKFSQSIASIMSLLRVKLD